MSLIRSPSHTRTRLYDNQVRSIKPGLRCGKQPRFISKIGNKTRAQSEQQQFEDKPQETQEVNEELLAKLKAAEEEAAALKQELSKAKLEVDLLSEAGTKQDEGPKWRNIRIDGAGLTRETPWAAGKKSEQFGLRESDLDFFTKNAPGETFGESAEMTEEQKAIVNKRLLIGGVLSVGFTALALIPDDKFLIFKPQKPLFFYLVPVIRSQELLKGAEILAENGQFMELETVIQRVVKEPNNIQENLRNAARFLDSGKLTSQAEEVILDFVERMEQIDYQKYYDIRGTPTGDQLKKFSVFSQNALKVAQQDLQKFLALMPKEDVEGATMQVFPGGST